MQRRLMLALALLPWIAAGTAHADDGITVSGVWSRASPPGIQQGVVYLKLLNHGPADALVGAATPAAAKADLHVTREVNGVMEMRPVASLALPTGQSVALKPASYHIMLMDLTKPLVAGEQFPITLRFAHAAPMTVQVSVQALGAAAPMPGMAAMPGMPAMPRMPAIPRMPAMPRMKEMPGMPGMNGMPAKPGTTP